MGTIWKQNRAVHTHTYMSAKFGIHLRKKMSENVLILLIHFCLVNKKLSDVFKIFKWDTFLNCVFCLEFFLMKSSGNVYTHLILVLYFYITYCPMFILLLRLGQQNIFKHCSVWSNLLKRKFIYLTIKNINFYYYCHLLLKRITLSKRFALEKILKISTLDKNQEELILA